MTSHVAPDAVTVAQVAIGLYRQHLAPGQMMHGIVTDGGQAPNIIPAHAKSASIIDSGAINVVVEVSGLRVTKGAKLKIEAAGGKVEIK